MTHATSGIGNSVQRTWWSAKPANADTSPADDTGGAGTPFAAALTTVTIPATPAATTGGAADATNPLRQIGGGLQSVLLEALSVERPTGSSPDAAAIGPDAAAIDASVTVGDDHGRAATAGSFTARVVSSDAGYDSSYGYYVTDANGDPVSGGILFANVKNGGNATVSGVDPNRVGFFIIPNGAGDNSGLTSGEAVTFKQVNGQWEAVDASNNVIGGDGANALFDNKALNGDGISHVEDNGAVAGNQNWEDLYGGGDRDFNDVNVNVTWNAAHTVTANNGTITLAAEMTETIVGTGDAINRAEWGSLTMDASSDGASPTPSTATTTSGGGGGVTTSASVPSALVGDTRGQADYGQILTDAVGGTRRRHHASAADT